MRINGCHTEQVLKHVVELRCSRFLSAITPILQHAMSPSATFDVLLLHGDQEVEFQLLSSIGRENIERELISKAKQLSSTGVPCFFGKGTRPDSRSEISVSSLSIAFADGTANDAFKRNVDVDGLLTLYVEYVPDEPKVVLPT